MSLKVAHFPGRVWLIVAIIAFAWMGGCSPEAQLEDLRSFQQSGRFAETIEPLRDRLDEAPDDPELNHLYGLALLQTDQSALAIWPLRKAAQDPDRAIDDGILLVQAILNGGSAEDGALAANKVLELAPDRVDVLRLLIAARLKARQNEEVLADVERLLELKPGDSNALVSRLVALLNLDRADEAEEALAEIGEAIENLEGGFDWEPRVCGGTATFMKEKGDPEAAELLWNDCLEQFPAEEMIVFAAIEFFNEIGQPRRATEILRRAVEAEPTHLVFIDALANRLSHAGETEEAERLLLAATEDGVNDQQAWFMLAKYHEQRDDLTKAADAMAKGLALMGKSPSLLLAEYVDLLVRAGYYDKAEEILPEFEGDPVIANLLHGRLLLVRGKPGEAIEALEAGLQLWPDNSAARELVAEAALQLGNYERAVNEYGEALRADPKNRDALFGLLRLLEALGRDQEAPPVLERYWRETPRDAESFVEAIRFASRAGQKGRIEHAARRLGEIPGQRGVVITEIAAIRASRGGPARGIEFIRKSNLDLTRPSNGSALQALVDYLVAAGKGGEALSAADAAVAAQPDLALFHEVRASALRAGGESDLAREALERALTLEPERASAIAKLASLVAELGDRKAAIALYDRAIEADPDASEYAWQAIQLFITAGNDAEVERRLDALLLSDALHAEAANLRARQLIESDPERAHTLARRAVRLLGGPDALEILGRTYLVRGNAEQAAKALGRAVELESDRPSTRYWLGMALSVVGDEAGAQRELNAALAAGDFPERGDAQAELARLNAE
ncbi:MAG: tetratricopeptide repeat protein [Deltaproteobacteria bacterium]|nr:tetratricopeptide repeat protein [Deltaproteobacteria bacterium]MBW2691493.1 tetratricopeptide repeat protein [Deltaproteobacteria bacterium]